MRGVQARFLFLVSSIHCFVPFWFWGCPGSPGTGHGLDGSLLDGFSLCGTYRSPVDLLATQYSIRRAHIKQRFQLGVRVLKKFPT